jgi:hypothetical protein
VIVDYSVSRCTAAIATSKACNKQCDLNHAGSVDSSTAVQTVMACHNLILTVCCASNACAMCVQVVIVLKAMRDVSDR